MTWDPPDLWATIMLSIPGGVVAGILVLAGEVDVMKLFDDSRPCVNSRETFPNPSKFAFYNSDWIGGDNSAVRDRCEQWFQQIPEGKKADLRGGFRSTDDSKHDGAFFELFLHELFTVLGCGVDFQPSIGGKTPDFLLNTEEGSIVVEATVAGHASDPLLAGPNAQKVLDDIGKLCSPHFSLLYDIEDTGNTTLPMMTPATRYISREVNKLLTDSDPDDVRGIVESCGRRAAPSKRIEWRGEAITVWLSPKALKPGERGCSGRIAIGRMNAKRIDPISSIRGALAGKAKYYKTLSGPLLLAVNAANPFFSLDGDALNILWGDLCFQYGMDADDPGQYSRGDDGFWSRSRSANVAGVLIFRNAEILNMSQSYATLYLNPRYCGPTPPSALLRLPHYIEVDGGPVRKEGENVAQVLGVSWS